MSKRTLFHCYLSDGERYTSCVVCLRCSEVVTDEEIKAVEYLARKQMGCSEEDEIETSRLPEFKGGDTWHLCNMYF